MRLLVFLLPWLELLTLIQLGIETSALTALGYVLLTFVLGMAILQRQGQGMFERLRESQEGRIVGPQLLLDDMAMGLAGLLLMVPGMISDAAALVVMIGPLRRRLRNWIFGPPPQPYAPQRDASSHVTIEGQYSRIDDDKS
ncbi:MAG: FxsA family protein [Halieaceae bacterium]|nr:FxsA family protein [Halieaceae bacterium]MCP5204703.1 FxsA family protein [Pseudomonadales bacterium]